MMYFMVLLFVSDIFFNTIFSMFHLQRFNTQMLWMMYFPSCSSPYDDDDYSDQ